MSKMNIVRTGVALPADGELALVRGFLFGCFNGFLDSDKKSWNGFWRRLINLEPGEIAQAEMSIPRNYKFHKKFFGLLDVGFEAWEPNRVRKSYKGRAMEKNREQFREDVTILAGFYEQTFDLKGRMVIRAQSISFAKMDDAEFEGLYSAVIDVLLREVCTTYKGRAELDAVVERVINFA